MNEGQPTHNPPLKSENEIINNIIFGDLDDASLRKYGLNPREVDGWSVDLLKGNIPGGFSTLEEFEEHILSVTEGKLPKRFTRKK